MQALLLPGRVRVHDRLATLGSKRVIVLCEPVLISILQSTDISETQTSSARRTGRLDLNLDLNKNSNESTIRKKPVICFDKDLSEQSLPQVIDVSIPLEKQRLVIESGLIITN